MSGYPTIPVSEPNPTILRASESDFLEFLNLGGGREDFYSSITQIKELSGFVRKK